MYIDSIVYCECKLYLRSKRLCEFLLGESAINWYETWNYYKQKFMPDFTGNLKASYECQWPRHGVKNLWIYFLNQLSETDCSKEPNQHESHSQSLLLLPYSNSEGRGVLPCACGVLCSVRRSAEGMRAVDSRTTDLDADERRAARKATHGVRECHGKKIFSSH